MFKTTFSSQPLLTYSDIPLYIYSFNPPHTWILLFLLQNFFSYSFFLCVCFVYFFFSLLESYYHNKCPFQVASH